MDVSDFSDGIDAMGLEILQPVLTNFQWMINFFDFMDLGYLFQPVNPVNLSDIMIPVDLKSKSWLVM